MQRSTANVGLTAIGVIEETPEWRAHRSSATRRCRRSSRQRRRGAALVGAFRRVVAVGADLEADRVSLRRGDEHVSKGSEAEAASSVYASRRQSVHERATGVHTWT
jgi:hypothetical protein